MPARTAPAPDLERLAARLRAQQELPDGAELAAIMLCEPVSGPAAVVCWRGQDETSLLWDVVDPASARSITDHSAIREAFALVAMAEELASLEDPQVLGELARRAGELTLEFDTRAGADVAQASADLQRTLERVREAAGEESTRASARWLDQHGTLLREVERAVERAARALAADTGQMADVAEQAWQLLAAVQRGPLATPPAVLIQRGREAGLALADEVLGR